MNLSIQKKIKFRSYFSGIGRKFLILFISFSIIPIIFISILGYNISKQIVIKQNLHYLELQNKFIESRLSDLFQKLDDAISPLNPRNSTFFEQAEQLIQNPPIKNCRELEDIKSYLRIIQQSNPQFFSIALITNSGTPICGTDSTIFLLSKKQIQDALRKNNSIILPNWEKKQSFIAILKSMDQSSQNNAGFLLGFIPKETIQKMMDSFTNKEQYSQIYILSNSNKLLLSSGYLPSSSVPAIWAEDEINNSMHFIERFDYRIVLRRVHDSYLFDWRIVSESVYETVMSDLIHLRRKAIIGISALFVFLTGLGFYFSQRIVIPLRKLVFAAQDIGDGLLESPLKIDTGDEIGLLTREFDQMRQNLLDSYENLEKKVEERTEELKQAQFQVVHQEKMASIGLLAAGIAHEIGNPLTSISSLTQVMRRRLKDKTNANYLNTIMKNIDRISHIVRELVDFSRPSSFRLELTDINQVIQSAVGIVKYDRRSKDIEFSLNLDENLPSTILVADQMLQVFINLLFNAVDAMQGYGNLISVSTAVKNKQILIKIRDTGGGIKEENMNRIFEPFYTTKEVGKGTGLGLSVSYGIIRNFKGEILVDSQIGVGSTFTIKLPIKKSF